MARDSISGEWLTCAYCGKQIHGGGTIYCAEHRLPKSRKDEENYGGYDPNSGYIIEKQYNDRAILSAWIIGVSVILFFGFLIFTLGPTEWKIYFTLFVLGLIGFIFLLKWLDRLEARYKEKNKVRLIAGSSKPKTKGLGGYALKLTGIIYLLVIILGVFFHWSYELSAIIFIITIIIVFVFIFFMRWKRRGKRQI